MAYISADPGKWEGQVVGNGHCVPYVQTAAGAPLTSSWTCGRKVRGSLDIAKGTAIATFDENGKYPNQPTGNHAAIYLGQTASGIEVYDQWVGKPVGQRTIAFKNGQGSASNDGDRFWVIE